MADDKCTKKTLVGLPMPIAFKNDLTSNDIEILYNNSAGPEIYRVHYDIDPSSVISMLYANSSPRWYMYSENSETVQLNNTVKDDPGSGLNLLDIATMRLLTAQLAKYDTVGRNWGLNNTGLLLPLTRAIPAHPILMENLPKIKYPQKIRNLITYGEFKKMPYAVVCRLHSADSDGTPILANPSTLFGFEQTVHDILRQPEGTSVQLNYEVTVFSYDQEATSIYRTGASNVKGLADTTDLWVNLLARMNFHLELLYKDLTNVKVTASIKLASIWYHYKSITGTRSDEFIQTGNAPPQPIRIAIRGFNIGIAPGSPLFLKDRGILPLLSAVDSFCMAENPTNTIPKYFGDYTASNRGGLDKLLTLLTGVDFALDSPDQNRLSYVPRKMHPAEALAKLHEKKSLPLKRSERLELLYSRQDLWRCLHPLNHGILLLDKSGDLRAKAMELYGSPLGGLVTARLISARNRYATLVFTYLKLRWSGWANAYVEKLKNRGWIRVQTGEFEAKELSFLVFFHWFGAIVFDTTFLQWTDPLDWLPLTLEKSDKLLYDESTFFYIEKKITMKSLFNEDWFDPMLNFTAFNIEWKDTVPETHAAMVKEFFEKA